MPAIKEDRRSSSDEVEYSPRPLDESSRGRESETTLLDKVVKENRVYGNVSPYGDSYGDQDEEWTVLDPHDKDETSPLIQVCGRREESGRARGGVGGWGGGLGEERER